MVPRMFAFEGRTLGYS
ncbi:hypothetical protein Goarm_011165 [Gossypium armourianum]|uniref:Uncharacterized protein n=1 Tax=Gossypium armourianum TaxID=34283 RepID=A0A7J9IW06_9ROSI|nr:hypothetical protein [Gossypium armourianum]